MENKQHYRSCLVIAINLFLLIYLVLFGGTLYAHFRMWWVNYQLFSVAEQLGYTPDALLRHEVKDRDWGFLLDSNCDASLYYTTTLSPAEFEQRVVQVQPGISRQGRSHPMLISSLSIPDLRFNGWDSQETLMLPQSEKGKVTLYNWYLGDISLDFYDLADVHAQLAYQGLPITGNIVELYKFGGAFQVWNCPRKITENTELPPN